MSLMIIGRRRSWSFRPHYTQSAAATTVAYIRCTRYEL